MDILQAAEAGTGPAPATQNDFYKPEAVMPFYVQIGDAYRAAYAHPKLWGEVSKCEDDQLPQRCQSGFSGQRVGEQCLACGKCLMRQAYPQEELEVRFKDVAERNLMVWYLERVPEDASVESAGKIALAAFAWLGTAEEVGSQKYGSTPAMQAWLTERFGDRPIVYMEEVFADETVRPARNLDRFKDMIDGFMSRLACGTVFYRTINPAMTRVPKRDFGGEAEVLERNSPDMPDWRDGVVIVRTPESEAA